MNLRPKGADLLKWIAQKSFAASSICVSGVTCCEVAIVLRGSPKLPCKPKEWSVVVNRSLN
jgi:hypothetical protein